ncbi:hypothetical protein C0585_06535 [Candidatus Woesearchaeota archaeon]|nr:MAG: hypothetical protein C0585_06535 [Candidatus Woesearchaeota archaeon]
MPHTKLNKLLKPVKNLYLPKEAKIESVEKFTKDTYLFKVKNVLDQKILPGQFIEVSIFGMGESPISVCSYNDNQIELLVRDVGNVTSHICRLKAKEKMMLRGPYGRGYPMDELKNANIVVISGGTGTAPPRSVIQYIQKHRNDYKDLNIFLGFRSPEDILFSKDLSKWEKEFKTKVIVDKGNPSWQGETGMITDLLDKYKFPKKPKFVLCGPPIMIKFVTEKLIKHNYPETDIYVSFERNMKCGVGKCGHCMIHGRYVCTDGPVFRYDLAKKFTE